MLFILCNIYYVHYILLCCVMLCCVILCCVLCYVVLCCYAMLCSALFCSVAAVPRQFYPRDTRLNFFQVLFSYHEHDDVVLHQLKEFEKKPVTSAENYLTNAESIPHKEEQSSGGNIKFMLSYY